MRTRRAPVALGASIVAAMLAIVPLAGSAADSPAHLYHGKTIEIDVGTGPGGGYDSNARLIAAYLGEFLPGRPAIVVANLPGGGGIRAANELYNTAPRDGTVIGTFSNAMLTEPLLGGGQAMFKPDGFAWIGSASREDGVCAVSEKSGVKSWDDLLHKQVIIGTDAPGTTTYMYPAMLKNLFGAKFKIVSGYPDGGQIALALERGEVQAICQTWSSLKVGHPDWLRDHFVRPVIALGLSRIPDLVDVPSVMELANSNEQREVLRTILAPTLAGRPFVAPPGTPAEYVDALRKGFAAMTHDPGFVADERKRRMDVDPVSGGDIEALVKQIYALPPEIISKVRGVVTTTQ